VINLVDEIIGDLEENGRTEQDIRWIGVAGVKWCTWPEFVERWRRYEYDNGYGGANINERLVVVGDDWWLERHEYDGAEWWEYKTLPKQPGLHAVPLRLK